MLVYDCVKKCFLTILKCVSTILYILSNRFDKSFRYLKKYQRSLRCFKNISMYFPSIKCFIKFKKIIWKLHHSSRYLQRFHKSFCKFIRNFLKIRMLENVSQIESFKILIVEFMKRKLKKVFLIIRFQFFL